MRGLCDGLTTAKNVIFITFYSRIRECINKMCGGFGSENVEQKDSWKMLH